MNDKTVVGSSNERAALQTILGYPGLPAVIYGIAQSALRTPDEPSVRRCGQCGETLDAEGMCQAMRDYRDAQKANADPYKAVCQGGTDGTGGKCTDPDCDKCWLDPPAQNGNQQ